ncbi:MAG TPA: YMGG-like glycine zipper-containing protein [Pyrinomonadaceae bacterium]|jgi:hypothetical protein|nr:YMGG-like glycine zipper-containing protein [Pyrinomonadaceae bacterium]
MSKLRDVVAFALALAVCGTCADVPAQRRRTPPPPARTTRRTPTPAPAPAVVPPSRLTGLYRLDIANSDNPRRIAQRAATFALPGERRRIIDGLMARLSSPEQLAIERRGNNVTLASTRAPRIAFEADGREQVEQAADGHQVRTRAVLYNEQLSVSATGNEEDAFSVNFDPIENGRRLRVTRRLFVSELGQEVVVQSLYDKVSNVARWTIYGEPETQLAAARNNQQRQQQQGERRRPQTSPPVIIERPPQPLPLPSVERRDADVIYIQDGTRFIASLDNYLTTAQSREGDRFTMTVRQPAQFAGATLEGYVSHVNPSGRISGRPEMRLSFDRLRLRDGRTVAFNGVVEAVSAGSGEDARVDNEGGSVQENDSQSTRTTQRVAIGAAVGAIIGAIASGGKGAAIGAAIGAGAGAGSVYAQGRDHLELASGTEFTIRATQQ